MNKHVLALACALIVAGFGAGVAVAEPTTVHAKEESQAVVPWAETALILEGAIFSPQGKCAGNLSSDVVLGPLPTSGCPGGQLGPCDTNFECRGYWCPLGSVRCCEESTGSGCQGYCTCCG